MIKRFTYPPSRLIVTLATALATASPLLISASNLIVNGDFEHPVVVDPKGLVAYGGAHVTNPGTGNPIVTSLPPPVFGWTVDGAVGLFNSQSGLGVIAGNQSLLMVHQSEHCGISQTVGGLSTGVQYTLRWRAMDLVGSTVARDYYVRVEAAGLAAPVAQRWTETGQSTPGVTFTLSPGASAGVAKISFHSALGSPMFTLDGVVLTPEPEALALATSLGLLVVVAYRRGQFLQSTMTIFQRDSQTSRSDSPSFRLTQQV